MFKILFMLLLASAPVFPDTVDVKNNVPGTFFTIVSDGVTIETKKEDADAFTFTLPEKVSTTGDTVTLNLIKDSSGESIFTTELKTSGNNTEGPCDYDIEINGPGLHRVKPITSRPYCSTGSSRGHAFRLPKSLLEKFETVTNSSLLDCISIKSYMDDSEISIFGKKNSSESFLVSNKHSLSYKSHKVLDPFDTFRVDIKNGSDSILVISLNSSNILRGVNCNYDIVIFSPTNYSVVSNTSFESCTKSFTVPPSPPKLGPMPGAPTTEVTPTEVTPTEVTPTEVTPTEAAPKESELIAAKANDTLLTSAPPPAAPPSSTVSTTPVPLPTRGLPGAETFDNLVVKNNIEDSKIEIFGLKSKDEDLILDGVKEASYTRRDIEHYEKYRVRVKKGDTELLAVDVLASEGKPEGSCDYELVINSTTDYALASKAVFDYCSPPFKFLPKPLLSSVSLVAKNETITTSSEKPELTTEKTIILPVAKSETIPIPKNETIILPIPKNETIPIPKNETIILPIPKNETIPIPKNETIILPIPKSETLTPSSEKPELTTEKTVTTSSEKTVTTSTEKAEITTEKTVTTSTEKPELTTPKNITMTPISRAAFPTDAGKESRVLKPHRSHKFTACFKFKKLINSKRIP